MSEDIQNKRILVLNVFEKGEKMKPQIEVKVPLLNI